MSRRLTPKKYAAECGVQKRTIYAWIEKGQLPEGATWTQTSTGRYIIHLDEQRHPPMPLYTDA